MHALITGASRGIGAALAQELSTRGMDVTRTARDHPDCLPLDVTDPVSCAALAARLEGRALDALVCNAGLLLDRHENVSDGYPPEMWAEMFAVNVTGVFQTVQALLPHLQMSDKARIMIISSQMASHNRAPGGTYIYRASKAAALNLGRNLATDLEGLGIAVGIYHPGWVKTDMGGDAAPLTVTDSATGLADRLEALNLEITGCFQSWDGEPHPY